ncbi:MAG: hypothetical protein DRJ69_06805 [Thermoprotei archaeon]|nr:MAG: hypothetical protein DRJ69_06805 [Thermoprotei archaeon]
MKGKLSHLCRSRVGDYRIIYRLERCKIEIYDVGHRERIYERL